MNKKILLSFLLGIALLCNVRSVSFAAEKVAPPHEQTSAVTIPEINAAGVYVNEDEGSATGYTVTFIYESAQANTVQLDIGANLYERGQRFGSLPDNVYTPYQWQDGMIGAGYEGYFIDLEKKEGTDLWFVCLPLSHALYQYNYLVDGQWADDPSNPAAKNPNNGNADGDSTVYVPLNPKKASLSEDFSYLDAESVQEKGTLTYVEYIDIYGNSAPLGVYTPYGYDKSRSRPYPVVYVSHGAGANEVNWFGCGHMNTEYDHLIEDGLVEPTIVVTMNNTNYEWDYSIIVHNLMNNILPYMEQNYHVSKEASGRAFCGLSMGGLVTSNVLYSNPDAFGYYGIFSGADGSLDYSQFTCSGKIPSIMIGGGIYDYGCSGLTQEPEDDKITALSTALKMGENNIPCTVVTVNGGHDWYTWPQLMYIFATSYLWK